MSRNIDLCVPTRSMGTRGEMIFSNSQYLLLFPHRSKKIEKSSWQCYANPTMKHLFCNIIKNLKYEEAKYD